MKSLTTDGKKYPVWRLLCSDFLSNLATSLAAKVVSLWFVLAVFGEERSVPWVSGFLAIIAVAQLIAGIFTGAVSDRHDSISTMTIACLVRAIASAGIIAILIFWPTGGLLPVIAVICLAVIETICDTAYFPAAASVSNRLEEGKELVRLLGWLRFFALVGSMVGPVLAGVGADRGWFAGVMALETLALLIATMILSPIRHSIIQQTTKPTEGFWVTWKAGLRAMAASESYQVMMPFALLEAVSSSALSMVAIYFFTATLHVPATWYGVWNALVAAGYAVGYLIAPWLSERIKFFKLLALSNLVVSLLLAAISMTNSPLVAVILGFSFATTQGVLNPPFQTIFIKAVPSEKVGQAMSVFISVIGAMGALAVPLWGMTADILTKHQSAMGMDPYRTILLIIVVVHTIMVICALANSRIRNISVD
ncbi:MFS transporter [Corynebacterium matruchotii]|uniref:MFS transporter n=1 Tax=Corynebacterium matruchotii TaxID=43768 RepID=UPI0028E6A58B|nr:MFS transporter [Corynebacterium matruchotii]